LILLYLIGIVVRQIIIYGVDIAAAKEHAKTK
jgi:hypothetical protein